MATAIPKIVGKARKGSKAALAANKRLMLRGAPPVGAVYKMSPVELRRSMQKVARERIWKNDLWEAYMFRAAALRTELLVTDLCLILDATALGKKRSPALARFLLDEVVRKGNNVNYKMSFRDVVMALNAGAKMRLGGDKRWADELVTMGLRRISGTDRHAVSPNDIALFLHSLTRLCVSTTQMEAARNSVASEVTPRIPKLTDGHTLSLLLHGFSPLGSAGLEEATEYEDRGDEEEAEEDEPFEEHGREDQRDTTKENTITHRPVLKMLFKQVVEHINKERVFNNMDVAHVILAVVNIYRRSPKELEPNGLVPPSLIPALNGRIEELTAKMKPRDIVRFMRYTAQLPVIETGKLLPEILYRIRHFTPASCLEILRLLRQNPGYDEHGKVESTIFYRLIRGDSARFLTFEQVCHLAGVVLEDSPTWEARECLLTCLLKFKAKNEGVPPPEVVIHAISVYSRLGIRDTHWVHVCNSTLYPLPELPPPILAMLASALARLSLPTVADQLGVYVAAQNSDWNSVEPSAAASLLYSAALFALQPPGRQPETMTAETLQPALVRARRVAKKDPEVASALGLFAVTDVGKAMGATAPLVQTNRPRCGFEVSLLDHIRQNWTGVDIIENAVTVGPVVALAAISPIQVAAFAQRRAAISEGDYGDEFEFPKAPPLKPDDWVILEALSDGHKTWYHYSEALASQTMRHRRHTVNAARYAELQALRTKGYRVLCVSEYMWPGDSEKRTDVILDQFAHLASGKREVEWKRVVEGNTPVVNNDVLSHVSDSS
ncbi:hypothetical protein Pmar_PMAR006512 [Perkinsus marinus ATCC 50983]|uniref:Uncharacterized protein n=1 Tax=Perkinsus marinus (strain ATCC 50983 / TXsc) TaxID=423536 RepID=C5K9W6_PERM5|nr:hypothetical protein Pmar_PMAR006512 [Perkinsus marinus ATCC 50983]EER18888.1 hypothetical protein Pmar_PMAR006512 [Perkinsus marinus ATCC 50983]|eukprot:XP_002787092.1 hypothetical protein Pmar_PMAR006512 [Perkinsus marinus ATCC 50983]